MSESRLPGDNLVDWELAVATAGRLVRPGPRLDWAQTMDVVTELRELAVVAEQHVVAVTGLSMDGPVPPVEVVDRMAWVRGNVEGFATLLAPVVELLLERQAGRSGGALTRAVGRRVTGVQVGTLLALLSSKVLGQYEVFLPVQAGREVPGRLSLVAPNIAEVERMLGVDHHDFRLWVCLHEQTHRLQFTAVPWLKGHIEGLVGELVDGAELDPSALVARLRATLGGVTDALRGRGELSLVELVQTPRQREVTSRVQAVMSLLEGHAEYVMDAAGPQVIPSLEVIRERFDARRRRRGSPLDRVVRTLLGMDLKMRQYADGKIFVTQVVDRVGMSGFNAVWTDATTLPTKAEVQGGAAGARDWVDRVHGGRPAGRRRSRRRGRSLTGSEGQPDGQPDAVTDEGSG